MPQQIRATRSREELFKHVSAWAHDLANEEPMSNVANALMLAAIRCYTALRITGHESETPNPEELARVVRETYECDIQYMAGKRKLD